MAFVLPNRKAFSDYIARLFRNVRDVPKDDEDIGIERCFRKDTSSAVELFPYQMLIRDYLKIETPYRGILLYHGLGSGKTCTSIAVAESLVSTLKIYVYLPNKLEENYISQIRECGSPAYTHSHHWIRRTLTDETRKEAEQLGISAAYLDTHTEFFTSTPNEPANWTSLPLNIQEKINAQVEDVLTHRFHYIHFLGMTVEKAMAYAAVGFDNSIVVIDEVHDFINTVAKDKGKQGIRKIMYDALYNAKQCKIVALSGTPVINLPNEIAFLMNLLRGPIEQIVVPFKTLPTWDEDAMTTALRAIPDIDTIAFDASKKTLLLTRNPPYFRSVYGTQGDRIAVQYKKEMNHIPLQTDWIETWKSKFEIDIGGGEIDSSRAKTNVYECLPSKWEEFATLFVDGLNIKNPFLFQRRIQGLVSYYKGTDPRLIPKRIKDEDKFEMCPMSKDQFTNYLQARFLEMKSAKNRIRRGVSDEGGDYRMLSRLACQYAIPSHLRVADEDAEFMDETKVPTKEDILAKLKEEPEKYLSPKALTTYSSKMKKLLENIQSRKTDNQFVYSSFINLEGLGVFSAILEANGWQKYGLVKNDAGQFVEDPTLDPEKPAYIFYDAKFNDTMLDMLRTIFNKDLKNRVITPILRQSIRVKPSLLLGGISAATGITLLGVRVVHIMEPYWHMALHDQIIGRAIRICSHASLPEPDRTVEVKIYLSVFTEEQKTTISKDYPNIGMIRPNDTSTIRYLGDPQNTFMSADEFLYEMAYEKGQLADKINILLKQAAIDCETHRKLHGRDVPVTSCMRFDSGVKGEDLAFKPSIEMADTDLQYLRNMTRKKRRLQKVMIKNVLFIIDPDTLEVYDGQAFEDRERLLLLGYKHPSHIEFIQFGA